MLCCNLHYKKVPAIIDSVCVCMSVVYDVCVVYGVCVCVVYGMCVVYGLCVLCVYVIKTYISSG